MAKDKKLDDLTQDAIAADRCGMSYGKYKALEYEEIRSGKRPAPLIAKKLAPARRSYDMICQRCGRPFISNHRARKYCSEECSRHADYMARAKRRKNEEEKDNENL